jgi:hypothetical protein
LELGGKLDLAAEPLHTDGRGQVGRQDLDHDLAAERGLFGLIDATHAPTELPLEAVGGIQRGLQAIEQLGQLDAPSRRKKMAEV